MVRYGKGTEEWFGNGLRGQDGKCRCGRERFSRKKQREGGRADFGAGCIPCIGDIRGTQCKACL